MDAIHITNDAMPQEIKTLRLPGDNSLTQGLTGSTTQPSTFGQNLQQAMQSVVAPQQAASEVLQMFSKGADGELHQSLFAMNRADITLRLAVSARNRFLEAYREIMRMGS